MDVKKCDHNISLPDTFTALLGERGRGVYDLTVHGEEKDKGLEEGEREREDHGKEDEKCRRPLIT